MLPLLLKPKLYAFKNRWRGRRYFRLHLTRDIVVLGFAAGLGLGIYYGTLRILEKLESFNQLAYLSPSHLIGMVLTLLFFMLVISNAATAFGTLFLAKDLDLLLAAPLSRPAFFYGKVWQIFLSSSWMPLVFLAPFLAAFANLNHAGPSYYVVCFASLLPYFLIPTALAVILVMIFIVLVPPHRTRVVLFCTAAALLLALYRLLAMLDVRASAFTQFGEIMRIVAILSLPSVRWSPANWAGQSIEQALQQNSRGAVPEFVLLYAAAATLLALAYLLLAQLHHYAYSRIGNLKAVRRSSPGRLPQLIVPLRRLIAPQTRALFEKEFKVISRDMTQAIQLLLLIVLASAYLYLLRVFSAAGVVSDEIFGTTWKNFLFVINCAIGAFVTTAICTRFVFPSLPLEGQAYWIIQNSPIDARSLLQNKFNCWLLPVTLISAIVFTTGAFAIEPSLLIAAINAASVFIISYGIVGLGIGFGAFFGEFDWEHPSQLQASFGSLVYMLFSTFLIFLSLIPTGIMIVILKAEVQLHAISRHERLFWVAACALFLTLTNYAACRWSLRLGAEALKERLER